MSRQQTKSELPNDEKVRAMRNKIAPIIQENVMHLEGAKLTHEFDRTMVYAVHCNGYGESEYEEDVLTVARRYNIPAEKLLRYNIRGSDMVPNEEAAFQDIMKMTRMLNNMNLIVSSNDSTDVQAQILQQDVGVDPVKRLRIVEVGFKQTRLLMDILQYMLKQWDSPHKYVQFIHVCDDDDMLQFWKNACLQGMCSHVEYVNRQDYTALGTLK